MDPQNPQCCLSEKASAARGTRGQEKPGQDSYGNGQGLLPAIDVPTREQLLQCPPWIFPQTVHQSHTVNTGDGAVGSAGLCGVEFAVQVFPRISGERNRRIAALLGTIVNQTVFTNIKVA